MPYKTLKEPLYTVPTSTSENGASVFLDKNNDRSNNLVALVPWASPSGNLIPRRKAWEDIDRYRKSAINLKTALVVHHDEALRLYINGDFGELTEEQFLGRPSPCTWDVGFYYAINAKDQLTFYVIPVLIDELGRALDYYTENYHDVDPAYYFKHEQGEAPSPQDGDEIAWDFGHIRPITLPLQ